MTLVTLQIAIEALEIQIESLKENKKVVPKNMVDYLNTKIKDMEIAQNELAMETFTISLTK